MFWELLATLFAGFAGAGIAMVLNLLTGGRLPKSAMPIAAGLSMIAFAIASEYTWYPRSEAQLPEEVVVIRTHEARNWYRPWTFAAPVVTRFAAVDTAAAQRNDAVPDQRIADVYLLERWRPSRAVRVAVDCTAQAQVPLEVGTINEDGRITSEVWESLAEDDPLLAALCAS